MNQLKREITLEKLLISPEKEKFQATHRVCYGIYDDDGLESLIQMIDIYDIEEIDNLSIVMKSLKLRARFNGQRKSEFYLCWLPNESVLEINNLLADNKFKDSKDILLNKGIFV
jgi:hypothetical protein